MKIFDRALFFVKSIVDEKGNLVDWLRPDVKVGRWSLNFNERDRCFLLEFACSRCNVTDRWLIRTDVRVNLPSISVLHGEHRRPLATSYGGPERRKKRGPNRECVPKGIITELENLLAKHVASGKGETWDSIENEGERII
jgi:hypothetical protein